jgi:hypothetical protein
MEKDCQNIIPPGDHILMSAIYFTSSQPEIRGPMVGTPIPYSGYPRLKTLPPECFKSRDIFRYYI